MDVEFQITLPATGEELRRNVEHALSLGLPDLGQMPAQDRALAIVANGPTARAFDHAAWRGETLALNGALPLFGDRGPDWWAAFDPQPLVADFVAAAPVRTTYLLASKCHPAVFEALQHRDVVLWHLDEHAYWDLVADRSPIRVAPSITISAFELGERLGHGSFQTWGWDGCYFGHCHHATAGSGRAAADTEIQINDVAGEAFPTTTSWMWEAQNAVARFEQTPRDVTVHGGGMIGAVLRAQGLLAA